MSRPIPRAAIVTVGVPALAALGLLVGAVAALPSAAQGPALGAPPASSASGGLPGAPDDPPGHTIVEVQGDARNGFSILRLDGSSEHPPTLSETVAECEEYDDEVDVAVCIAEVETWFAGLEDLQLSLAWALQQGG